MFVSHIIDAFGGKSSSCWTPDDPFIQRKRPILTPFQRENRKIQGVGQKRKVQQTLEFTGLFWRRVRDSNPRDLSVYSISSAAPSTTRTTLRVYFRPVFFPEICSKIHWRENRRDGKKYSILRFSVLRNIKENQGDEIPSFRRNFESGPLWPLRYRSK